MSSDQAMIATGHLALAWAVEPPSHAIVAFNREANNDQTPSHDDAETGFRITVLPPGSTNSSSVPLQTRPAWRVLSSADTRTSLIISAPSSASSDTELSAITPPHFHFQLVSVEVVSWSRRQEVYVGGDSGVVHDGDYVGTTEPVEVDREGMWITSRLIIEDVRPVNCLRIKFLSLPKAHTESFLISRIVVKASPVLVDPLRTISNQRAAEPPFDLRRFLTDALFLFASALGYDVKEALAAFSLSSSSATRSAHANLRSFHAVMHEASNSIGSVLGPHSALRSPLLHQPEIIGQNGQEPLPSSGDPTNLPLAQIPGLQGAIAASVGAEMSALKRYMDEKIDDLKRHADARFDRLEARFLELVEALAERDNVLDSEAEES
ncbi:hypothetical protein DFJ73DRAFT_763058 [Zopfochytrium polystomum]|nr:hypothetical protein DFJ73DRAFT_763058 [Zopfochytrium polystomum]